MTFGTIINDWVEEHHFPLVVIVDSDCNASIIRGCRENSVIIIYVINIIFENSTEQAIIEFGFLRQLELTSFLYKVVARNASCSQDLSIGITKHLNF